MINYSIIIPHKNSQELLEYCLSTIPERDDVQVIVVDDNSDPQKVDFGYFPKWKGANYECYFTKEGKGAGYARNVGLDHAIGKWVLFVDADDYLLPTIDDIMDECMNSEADIIYFRPKAVMLEDRQTPSNRDIGFNQLIDEYFQTGDENNIRCRFFTPICKFIKKSLIDRYKIRFDEIQYSNDVFFSVLSGCNACTIMVQSRIYYVITESAHSLTSNYLHKSGEVEIRATAFFKAQEYIYNNGYVIDENLALDYLRRLLLTNVKLFRKYFRSLQSFGLTRTEIIHRLYFHSKKSSRIKRSIYAYIITMFLGK